PHAVAAAHVAAPRLLAAADVDDVGIARRHGHGADRAAELAVADVLPGLARVLRLPHAAARAAEVVDVAIARDAADRPHAPAAERTDETPLERLEQNLGHRAFRILRGRGCGLGLARQGDQVGDEDEK